MMHSESHPLAGQKISICLDGVNRLEVTVQNWWDWCVDNDKSWQDAAKNNVKIAKDYWDFAVGFRTLEKCPHVVAITKEDRT